MEKSHPTHWKHIQDMDVKSELKVMGTHSKAQQLYHVAMLRASVSCHFNLIICTEYIFEIKVVGAPLEAHWLTASFPPQQRKCASSSSSCDGLRKPVDSHRITSWRFQMLSTLGCNGEQLQVSDRSEQSWGISQQIGSSNACWIFAKLWGKKWH